MNVVFLTKDHLYDDSRHKTIDQLTTRDIRLFQAVAMADIVVYVDEHLQARTMKNRWGFTDITGEPLEVVMGYIHHTIESRAQRS